MWDSVVIFHDRDLGWTVVWFCRDGSLGQWFRSLGSRTEPEWRVSSRSLGPDEEGGLETRTATGEMSELKEVNPEESGVGV